MDVRLRVLLPVWLCAVLGACGDSSPSEPAPVAYKSVPRAVCGEGDRTETDLQGRVPLADRDNGDSQLANNCNLDLIGQHQGEGASWQFAWFEDCGYYGTANTEGQKQKGVVVVDVSDPTQPRPSAHLTSASMLDPWESLKVDEERELLAAVRANGGSGGAEIDIYDLSQDCRNPELLYSGPPANSAIGQSS